VSTKESRTFRALVKAARDGSPEAQYHLAAYLATGDGCEKDVMAAADWYAKAAAQRHPEALYNLGLMHLLGEIGKKAPRKGFALIKQGADLGSWDAHWFLWQVYAGGCMVKHGTMIRPRTTCWRASGSDTAMRSMRSRSNSRRAMGSSPTPWLALS
jgi:TPR repeat protein